MVKAYLTPFKNQVTAAFSSRIGGLSQAPYNELNLGLSTGDDIETVQKNRMLFFKEFGYESSDIAFASQTHSDHIHIINEPGIYQDTDALITNKVNQPIVIQVADCACLFIFDKINHVVACVHSGWKGTHKNILGKTITILKDNFNSRPEDLEVVISPCLSQNNFEVGFDVYQLFEKKYFTFKSSTKWLFNMKQVILDQLSDCKVQNIYVDNNCTYDDVTHCFSYRRDREKSGRMMGFMVLH